MSDSLQGWLRSLDEPDEEDRPDETDIFVQLDALYEERSERGDRRWFPPGPDPQGLERLVRERWERRLALSRRGGLSRGPRSLGVDDHESA